MYVLGIGGAVIILVAQYLLHIDFHRSRKSGIRTLSVKDVTEDGYQKYILEKFREYSITVLNVSVEKPGTESMRNYVFKLEIPDNVTEDEIISMVKYKSSIKAAV